MTDEKHNFSHAPEAAPGQQSISALDPQPVLELGSQTAADDGDAARAGSAPAHLASAGAAAADAPLGGERTYRADISFAAEATASELHPDAAHFADPVRDDVVDEFELDAEDAGANAAPAPLINSALLAGGAPNGSSFNGAAGGAGASRPAEGGASPDAGADVRPQPDRDPLFADLTAEAAPDAQAAVSPAQQVLPLDRRAAGAAQAPAEDILGNQDTGELPPVDAIEAAAAAAKRLSPEDTAEIDVAAVEAKLKDPGTTQSFSPVTEERIPTDSTYDAGTTTTLMWGARSDVGCVRSHNEDSYLVASPLFAVCDGMGGHAAGEVASSIAVETIAKMSPGSADAAGLAAAVEAANAAIIEAASNGVGRPGMGCTATVAYIEGNVIAIAHVGDSRAYLMHDGVLTRITRDHSYVEELVDAGEITADEARVHPNRSVITRALGSDPSMYADHFQLNIEEGDRLILCSDGLSSMIPDSEIENISTKSSTAQMCTDNLVDAALAAGGADNVSVVVVDVVDDGRLKQVIRTHRRNVLIAVGALLAAVVIAVAVIAFSISNAVYLGVNGDTVGLYRGIPQSFFGIELNRLQEETTIKLSDLPEDTQNRLRAGIPQDSLDQAWDTLSDYRVQIDEAQSQQANTAEAIRESTEAEQKAEAAGEPQPDAGGGEADADAPADAGAQPDQQTPTDPNTQNQEGGA